jgi:uncharacterized membrane protein YfcA
MTLPALLGPEMAAAVLVMIAAGLLRGFAGFGGTMVIVPGLSLLIPTPQAVAIAILLNCAVTVQLMPGIRQHADWRRIAPMGLAAVLTPPLGALILTAVDAEVMRRVVALVVLAFTVVLMRGWRLKGRPGPAMAMGVGAVSGVITGAAGVGGPPIVLAVFAGDQSALEKRADMIGVFGVMLLATAITFVVTGVVRVDTVWWTIALAPVFFLATWVGQRLFYRAGEALFHRIAFGVLLVVAGAALVA